jgi:hypothetical protein
MALVDLLMASLAVPLGKFLLKNYLGEPASAVGGGLLDVARKSIESYQQQREAERQFERLGERIVVRLLPLFERASDRTQLNPAAVANELAMTLDGHIHADFFLTRDLDPVKLSAALRAARPADKGLSEPEAALYDRALDETVRYLVDVAVQLPHFESKAAGISLQRLARIGDDLDKVLERTQRIEREVEEIANRMESDEEKRSRYEADYRQVVTRKLDYVELFGVDVSPEARNQSLSVAYVSLNVQQQAGSQREPISLPVHAVLDTLTQGASRLLIRGEAGSGKSTLFRWAALEAASLTPGASRAAGADSPSPARVVRRGAPRLDFSASNRPRATRAYTVVSADGRGSGSWRTKIPFLLRLRDCDGGRLPTPDELPLQVARGLGAPPQDWVKAVLTSGRAMVLLDGVDEVPNPYRVDLRRDIGEIVTTYPHNLYLLSTRPAAVPAGWLSDLDFHEAAVDPMSDSDKRYFIERWHRAVARELELQGRPDETLGELAGVLVEQLAENPPVSRLASNPLLCAMICALHRERHRKLPENQQELCEAVCHMLLHRREREGGLSLEQFPSCYRDLSYPQKRSIVQDIAHYMIRNGLSTATRPQVTNSIEGTVRLFPGRSDSSAEEILEGLVERSGIVRESQPDRIDFIHNTIKEFLAGERFANDGDVGRLAEMVTEPSWQPVVLFAASTNRKGFATELVRHVLNPPRDLWKRWPGEGQARGRRARQIFALRLRAMALHLDQELETELLEIERKLFPPHTFSDAEALASGGDATLEYLKYQSGLDEASAAACVRTLRLIGTARARRYLRDYLADSRPTVVSELAQAIDPLEIPAVIDDVVAGKEVPPSARAQIRDLALLAPHTALRSLNLAQTQARDISVLRELRQLRYLNLSGMPLSELAPLSNLLELEFLDLSHTRVTDLAAIADLPSLQVLNLSGTGVRDLSSFNGISLKSLDLSDTPVESVAPISTFAKLESLALARTRVRDLSPLLGACALRLLDLSGTSVGGERLPVLEELEELYLTDAYVGSVEPLTKLKRLRVLDLSGTRIRDVAPLARLSALEMLYLVDSYFSHPRVQNELLVFSPNLKINTVIRR